jgi:hypothetical protein
MDRITLENAIRCNEDARRELRRRWLAVEWYEDGYDLACAGTPVPEEYRALCDALHATAEHLLALRESFAAV